MTGDTHHFDQWLYDDNDLDFSTPEPPGNFTELVSHHGRRSRSGGTDVGSHTRAVIQESPNCVSYTIKWSLGTRKSKFNKLTQNTVQNIGRYPSHFWESDLESEIDSIVREKKLNNTHEPDETQITFSITTRGVDKIPFRYTGLNVKWDEADEQIDNWSELVRDGGKLVVQIAFIFKENNQSVSSGPGRRGQSATNGQLNERAAIHNHQDATDEPPIWEKVYDIFECPGAGCDIGPYCFHHQATGVRYPVATKTLTKLVEYAEKGGRLKEHSDVPKHLQNEIISPPTKRKQSDGPQINITNVMPGSEGTPLPKKLRIAGPRDKAIERYRDWHCSQVDDPNWKKEFHAIAKLTLLARLPLNRLFEAQEEEIKFFVSQKIPRGIAHQWVGMVNECNELFEE
ncbi:unnamed protein product [Fusarium graminearum]|uniref:Uncharacterized protein n=1 Tax=Gibberella zeae TaxID=5518 RepID=A0A4E9EMA3_GIBZA|nr:unnamed protein product [Fusarium graminearum]